ncbi:MAG: type 1 glutamine amidotransferase-like domain-containing protein [Oscillibacter sp.]|nr:type 1 glutamine amidotransferase-like domain-containing protein [Oscillibacter sp.]MBD5154648.1 type 1 glutamine amidotransferase-like domain-containing protein [Oscillibacter sp.]
MIAYLTSSIGGYEKKDGARIPTQLSTENGFLENLQKHWRDNSKVLIVSSDAGNIEKNDSIMEVFAAAFPMSGLSISQMDICDSRNEKLVDEIAHYDVLILAGGHVPTQNKFFERIRLKEHITDFDGILIGISAGTMNSAEVVYAQPELEGESIDKEYRRFLSGLGITKLMILPHYQKIKDDILDGQRLFEDITYPDSYGREFYALEDGSYFIADGKATTLFGTAYLIKDGDIKQICEKDKSIRI